MGKIPTNLPPAPFSITAFQNALILGLVWSSGNKYQEAVKNDADSKIATANVGSETARKEAAKAIEKVAGLTAQAEEARVKQKELEQENLKLRADLNKSTGEVAKLQIEAADAQRALLELQERIRPRHLTREQKIQLTELLSKKPRGEISISCVVSNREALDFAKEIFSILKELKWKVVGKINAIQIFGSQPVGLKLTIKTQRAPSLISLENLRHAFDQIGFKITTGLDNNLSEFTVGVFVGEKNNPTPSD